jgi:hypothetical protein
MDATQPVESPKQPELRWLRRLRNGLVLSLLFVAPWAFACIYPGGLFAARTLGSSLAAVILMLRLFGPGVELTRREKFIDALAVGLFIYAAGCQFTSSVDSQATLFSMTGYAGLAALYWAVRDWTRENETVPRKLLWFILLNAGLIAVVALAHRVSASPKVLWIFKPEVTNSFYTFGPFEYRALASQFYNLLWPVAVGLYFHDRAQKKAAPASSESLVKSTAREVSEISKAARGRRTPKHYDSTEPSSTDTSDLWSAALPRRFADATTSNQREELAQQLTQPSQTAQSTQTPPSPAQKLPPALFPISLVILLMACPAITGSRGGLLMSLFGMILLGATLLLRSGPGLIRPRRIVAIAIAVVVLFALFGIKPIQKRLRETNYNLKTLVSMAGRSEQNENTWRIIADHPLWGVGPGAYETAYRQYHFLNVFKPARDIPTEQPAWDFFYAKAYNDWLQTLAEWGPLASIAIIIALATILLAPAPPENFLITAGLRIGILTTLVHASFDNPLQNFAILTHLAVLLALALPNKVENCIAEKPYNSELPSNP